MTFAYLVQLAHQYLDALDVNKDGKIDLYDLHEILDVNKVRYTSQVGDERIEEL